MIYNWIQDNQMNIMLALCAICAMMAIILLFTKFLSRRRQWSLILMELIAAALLGFDRAAYIYKGNTSHTGYVMVRLSNFMVFFLTSGIVLGFNLYLIDLLRTNANLKKMPLRLKAVNIGAAIGMALVVVSHFTDFYYYFDEENNYHRGPGFLISYFIPVLFPLVQFTVIFKYRKAFSKLIYTSLVLYIFMPIIVGIIQIFAYGLSIVNMAMVLVSVSLYIFTYLDINKTVEKMHEIEVGNLQKEQQSMKQLFDQTVTAFVNAVEKRAPFSEGHSLRVANYSRKIAAAAGKSEQVCNEVYYSALLHDVGMMGLPDELIIKVNDLTEEELRLKQKKPVLGAEILSSITEYPYLSRTIRYSHERYDGTGFPDGLKGEEIPELSRIIAVANFYETMTSMNISHTPMTYQVVREELIKQSEKRFDPQFVRIMVQIMDEEHEEEKRTKTEKQLDCGKYRQTVSSGISIEQGIKKISFSCEPSVSGKEGFSAPSVIIFDSYDQRVHDEPNTIEVYNYLEYGELWFDGHYISTNARNIEVKVTKQENRLPGVYEISFGRYEDHLLIHMTSCNAEVEAIVALPDNSKSALIGLTGENCRIRNITVRQTEEQLNADSIPQIVSKISYIDRLESDLPNVQINHFRSAATNGVPIVDNTEIVFHTMSLPSANLVWHCPYIVIFYAEDGKVGGEGYQEFVLLKINGESSGNEWFASNKLVMKKSNAFPGWDTWKEKHKAGMECTVRLVRRGNKIIVSTENLGVSLENTTTIFEAREAVYVALTGDQVALTDIRVK